MTRLDLDHARWVRERVAVAVVYGVAWYGVVWCGVVWCGVVWCSVVWCGVVWRKESVGGLCS